MLDDSELGDPDGGGDVPVQSGPSSPLGSPKKKSLLDDDSDSSSESDGENPYLTEDAEDPLVRAEKALKEGVVGDPAPDLRGDQTLWARVVRIGARATLEVAKVAMVEINGYTGVVREPGGPKAKEAAEEKKRLDEEERIQELKDLGRLDPMAEAAAAEIDDGYDPEELFKDYCVKLGQQKKQVHRQLDPLRAALRVAYVIGDRQLEGAACKLLATAYVILAKDESQEKPPTKEGGPATNDGDGGQGDGGKPKRGKRKGGKPKGWRKALRRKSKGSNKPGAALKGKTVTSLPPLDDDSTGATNGTGASDENIISVDISKTSATEPFEATEALAVVRLGAYVRRTDLLIGLWAESHSAKIRPLYVTQMDFGAGLGR